MRPMRTTFKVLFFIKRNAQKKDGTAPIVSRITINGKSTHFNTKLFIEPERWSVKTNRAKGRTAESLKVNNFLNYINATLFGIYQKLSQYDTTVTAEKVKNSFLGIGSEKYMLLELFSACNEDIKKQVGISKSKATYQKYEVCKRHLANYIKAEYHLSDIDLRDLNHSFIVGFEVFLKTQCRCNPNTTVKFIQKFKSVVITAQKNGWLKADPFANYKISLQKVDRGYLTESELQQIIEKSFSTERLERIRDIFIFSCYTGLAFIDVKNLKAEHISESFDGSLWITIHRKKTNTKAVVPLLELPQIILKKYENSPDGKLLPIPTNQKTNAYLKEIADVCGITKNLTFHIARHTFATTVTLSKGVPIESVSKMLGHTNIKTTQIYARVTNEKISADMRILAAKLKENNMDYSQLTN